MEQEKDAAEEAATTAKVEDPGEGSKSSVIAAIAGNIGVAVVKFIASALSGSSALFSEAIHSLVDCGNGILLLIGMRKARRKPDFRHPFGSGKELYFYTLIVSLAIFFLGGGVALMEGFHAVEAALAGKAEVGDPLVAYIVLIAGGIIEGFSLKVALKSFNGARGGQKPLAFIKEAKDPSLFAVVFEDTAAELGLLFALVGTVLTQVTGNAVFDGAASMLIGALLCSVAFVLLRESKGLLVGEGVSADEVEEMRALALEDDQVKDCGRILTMYMGPASLVVVMDVTLSTQLSYVEIDRITDGIEARIRERWPEATQVFIEIENKSAVAAQHQEQDAWTAED